MENKIFKKKHEKKLGRSYDIEENEREKKREDFIAEEGSLYKKNDRRKYKNPSTESICQSFFQNGVKKVTSVDNLNKTSSSLNVEFNDEKIDEVSNIDSETLLYDKEIIPNCSSMEIEEKNFPSKCILDMQYVTQQKNPYNKYNHSKYFTNWNKISFQSYRNCYTNSQYKYKGSKRARYTQPQTDNAKNKFISFINNVMCLLSISEFLCFNDIIKIMMLCKATYAIFNTYFIFDSKVLPFAHSLSVLLRYMKKHAKFQVKVLKSLSTVELDNANNEDDKNEIVPESCEMNDSWEFENRCGSVENKRRKTGTMTNLANKNRYIIDENDNLYDNDSIPDLSLINHNNFIHTTNYIRNKKRSFFKEDLKGKINIKFLFMLFEYCKIYLSKYYRENYRFNKIESIVTYYQNKKGSFIKDIYFYGNKVYSYEQKVKLKYHIRKRWNIKTNYLHEYFFQHQTEENYDQGILKIVELDYCPFYPSFSVFLTVDKIGFLNLWTLKDMNVLFPKFRKQYKLTIKNKTIKPRDLVTMTNNRYAVSDKNCIYCFTLGDTEDVKLDLAVTVSKHFSFGSKVQSVIAIDDRRVCIGLQKATCARIDIEKHKAESVKANGEDFRKMKIFDKYTNIVLSDKNIFFDDKRMPNYVSFLSRTFINSIKKQHKNHDDFFTDFDLTGISLCTLNSDNTMYCFDLRFNYATSCLKPDDVIHGSNQISVRDHLRYLYKLKNLYNSVAYAKYGKRFSLHDNILLTPYLIKEDKLNKKKEHFDDFIKNKIISDESFIYTVINRDPAVKYLNAQLPSSVINIWRWCETRQCKSIFNFADYPITNRFYGRAMYKYEDLVFDSVYKLFNAPNHLFITYENSNYIHSLLPPNFDLTANETLQSVPLELHPTNL